MLHVYSLLESRVSGSRPGVALESKIERTKGTQWVSSKVQKQRREDYWKYTLHHRLFGGDRVGNLKTVLSSPLCLKCHAAKHRGNGRIAKPYIAKTGSTLSSNQPLILMKRATDMTVDR